MRKRKERVYWVKDDESHPIPNSQLHQPPITPYSHFPFLRFSLSNTFHIHSHFSRKTQIPTQLTKKKKNIKHAFPFLSLFFSPNTPKPPLPLFVSEDNPNSLAGKKKFRVFFSGKRMVTPENNTNWLFDYGLMDDIPVPDANFSVPNPAFTWPVQALNGSSSVRYLLSSSLPLSILGFCPIFFDWGSVSCYQFRALFVFGFSWFVLEFVV